MKGETMALTPREALLREYGEGWRAGARDALRLLLGEPSSGAVPFGGERSPELELWARSALENLEDPAPLDAALRAVQGD